MSWESKTPLNYGQLVSKVQKKKEKKKKKKEIEEKEETSCCICDTVTYNHKYLVAKVLNFSVYYTHVNAHILYTFKF